jgi:AcrR family transcriptional regulator
MAATVATTEAPDVPEAPLDRRRRRRLQTIEEVLDVATAIMAEQGVVGLSVGEIARRMGIKPPSLYVYFPSKHALYDALFERGARAVLEEMAFLTEPLPEDQPLEEQLLVAARAWVRWAVDHPAYTQLLYWRPVPGFEPSSRAFAPAVEMVERSTARMAEMQRRGLLRDDVEVTAMHGDWIALLSGVVTRQLSNAPEEGFEEGRFTGALGRLAAMFASYYGPQGGTHSAGQG